MEWGKAIAVVSCMLVVLAAFVMPGDFVVETASAYIPHVPIVIDDDHDFTADNGVIDGSGTVSDPYIIEGLQIDGENGRACISVSHSDKHLVIRDCALWNASTHTIPYGHGIYLDEVSNCTIEGNLVYECYTGMFLSDSSNNTISDNTIRDIAHMGLQLYGFCSDNVISRNEIHSIDYDAICIWECSHRNVVTDNWLHDNRCDGIDVMYTDGNIITRNVISDCGSFAINFASLNPSDNTLICGNMIRQCNYGASLTGWRNTLCANIFDNCPQGVRFVLGGENLVVRNEFDACGGLTLMMMTSCTIYGNNLSLCDGTWDYLEEGDQQGAIVLHGSDSNVILNNTLHRNYVFGVALNDGSDSNSVSGCNFIYNNGAQLVYSSECVQGFDNGEANRWDVNGRGNFWSDWTEPDSDEDGIVDTPYRIDGLAWESDNYPLTEPVLAGEAFMNTEISMSGDEGDRGWYVSAVEVSLSVSGNWTCAESTYFRIHDTEWYLYSDPIHVSMEGIHMLEFYSEDASGIVEDTRSTEIKIDYTPPTLEMLTTNYTLFDSNDIEIAWIFNDSCSGVDCLEYSLDGNPYAPCEYSSSIELSNLSEGYHVLVVRAYDQAGNNASQELWFEIETSLDDGGEEPGTSGDGELNWIAVLGGLAVVSIVLFISALVLLRRRRQP